MEVNVKLNISDIEELVLDIKEARSQLMYGCVANASRRDEALKQVLVSIADSCNEKLLLYNENSYEAYTLNRIIMLIEEVL